MNQSSFLAHISEDGREQTVQEHLRETAELSRRFAEEFNAGDQGYYAGLLHDIGKYSHAFQKRLHGGPRVDHSTAGAFEAIKANQAAAAFCIAGHHAGLPDGGSKTDIAGSTLYARLNSAVKGQIPDYSDWKKEIRTEIPEFLNANKVEAAFLTRMLYSCLVDADFLNTEAFMAGEERESVPLVHDELLKRLNEYISPWFSPSTELNEKRCRILKQCIEHGTDEKGLFSLTVPTGGGKTIASLAFALHHAKAHSMKRIIYVIPYTSIIEQTADIFRQVLGDENILEHHSGVQMEESDDEIGSDSNIARATENWDMPIVVTTAVQFFESLFASRSSKCRKLHNIANSVIIFDEAQMIPVPYLLPCVYAIAQLVKHCNATAVLCTATQPVLNVYFQEYLPQMPVRELCPDELFRDEVFRRVTFEKTGKRSAAQIAEQMNERKQILCIVNSRKAALQVYNGLEEGSYHLSTLMFPAHRKQVLSKIRQKLKNGQICRVVATSLIEAGVDVDFPAVFREEAGLDSVLQAAGRCNREGKRPREKSKVTVFQSGNRIPPLFDIPVKAGRYSMEQHENIAGKEAVETYFRELLSLKGPEELDRKNILVQLRKDNFPFQTIAEQFKLIDTDTRTIYIPLGEGEALVERLLYGTRSRALYRALAQYGVSVYENHFKALESAGAIQLIDDGNAVLTDTALYSLSTGLSMEADSGQGLFI